MLGRQNNIKIERRDSDGKIIITDGESVIIPSTTTVHDTLRKMGNLPSPSGITKDGLELIQMLDKTT